MPCLKLTIGSVPWTCQFCGAQAPLQSCPQSSTRLGINTFTLSPPAVAVATDIQEEDLPCVVFAIDISGSMMTKTQVPAGVDLPIGQRLTAISRLQCVQAAVHLQVEAIRKKQPTCPIVIVPFSTNLSIITEAFDVPLDESAITNSDMDSLLREGSRFGEQALSGSVLDTQGLIKKIWALRPTGTTALGPALAVSVGLCPRGGKVVVCTDGLANRGVGVVKKGDTDVPFYCDMGACAEGRGVTVSVITMEGEDCAMEHLGTVADLSGGQVEIVSPTALDSKVSDILSRQTLATNAVVSVLGSGGLKVDGEVCGKRLVGTISIDTDVSFVVEFEEERDVKASLLQTQIRYVGKDGGEYITVVTQMLATSSERVVVEQDMDAEVVAVASVQQAARLAQNGSYRAARCALISTQRLLQRGMKAPAVQRAYLPFIVQAEKLDQFIREREAQEELGVSSAEQRKAQRDDEAARAMYQMKSLSLACFRDQWRTVATSVAPRPSFSPVSRAQR